MFSVALLAIQCGLLVDEAVLDAIVRVESSGNPYALAVNGDVELVRQPRDVAEAVLMARWLEGHGYNFDAGLGQVNSANLSWLGLDVASVFDPCANLEAASRVLHDCYDRASERFGAGQAAVVAALSCYNTGDFTGGVRNGYVDAVIARASGPLVIRGRHERDTAAGVCSAAPVRRGRRGGGQETEWGRWKSFPRRRTVFASRVAAPRRGPGSEAQGERVARVFGEPLADVFGEGRR
jgi:type IV secretion system protein VirB1